MAIIVIFATICWLIMVMKLIYVIIHNAMKIKGTVSNIVGFIIGLFVAYRILVYLITPTTTGGNLVVTSILLIAPVILIILGLCVDK